MWDAAVFAVLVRSSEKEIRAQIRSAQRLLVDGGANRRREESGATFVFVLFGGATTPGTRGARSGVTLHGRALSEVG